MTRFQSGELREMRDELLRLSDGIENAPYVVARIGSYRVDVAGSSTGNCSSNSHSGNSSHSASKVYDR